jgi:Zn-dependent peptidase ImmA (M78 family)/transcriptional regulator with XRE-family HTH domain
MARVERVPLTPAVLRWAIVQSGLTPDAVASRIDIERNDLDKWLTGESLPGLSEFRRLASILKRPLATFLLPEPPKLDTETVSFRAPLDADRSGASSVERTHLRSALRLQRAMSWIVHELDGRETPIPHSAPSDRSAAVAQTFRARIGVGDGAHVKWKTASEAFAYWRGAIERIGIVCLSVPMGRDSCRGFSIWDPFAPLIAVNSAFSPAARIFTLFHECGHLLTRTQSMCLEGTHRGFARPSDKVERWCEQFAADVVLPWATVTTFLSENLSFPDKDQVTSLSLVYALAEEFKVSARAVAILLIHHQRATWNLYKEIPPSIDNKERGFGRGGRTRGQLREGQLGRRATILFARSVRRGLLSRADAMTYLRVGDTELEDYSTDDVE